MDQTIRLDSSDEVAESSTNASSSAVKVKNSASDKVVRADRAILHYLDEHRGSGLSVAKVARHILQTGGLGFSQPEQLPQDGDVKWLGTRMYNICRAPKGGKGVPVADLLSRGSAAVTEYCARIAYHEWRATMPAPTGRVGDGGPKTDDAPSTSPPNTNSKSGDDVASALVVHTPSSEQHVPHQRGMSWPTRNSLDRSAQNSQQSPSGSCTVSLGTETVLLSPEVQSSSSKPTGSTKEAEEDTTSRKKRKVSEITTDPEQAGHAKSLIPSNLKHRPVKGERFPSSVNDGFAKKQTQPASFRRDDRDSFADSSLVLLEEKLEKEMASFLSDVDRFVLQELKTLKIDWEIEPKFISGADASEDLTDIYRQLYGNGRASNSRAEIMKSLQAAELVVSCIGAFFYKEIFDIAPYPSAAEKMEEVRRVLGVMEPEYNSMLARQGVSFEHTLRKAHHNTLSDKEKQERMFGVTADQLSLKLGGLLQRHVMGQESAPSSTAFEWNLREQDWADKLYPLITRALAFSAKLSSSSQTFRFKWSTAGAAFDKETMEASRDVHEGDHIVAAFFPGLFMDKAGEELSVQRTQVWRAS